QIPCARDLRLKHTIEAVARLMREHAVVDNSCGVDDAGKRRQLAANLAEEPDDVFVTRHVGWNDAHAGARCLKRGERLKRPVRNTATPREHDRASAVLDEPPR